jgi:hypothetical protein
MVSVGFKRKAFDEGVAKAGCYKRANGNSIAAGVFTSACRQ